MYLHKGLFGAELNISDGIALYRCGDPKLDMKYRPISVLPFFKEFLKERIM